MSPERRDRSAPSAPSPSSASVPPSYRRFIVLGIVLVLVAVVAGVWLLRSVADTSTSTEPSTEQQVGADASGAAATPTTRALTTTTRVGATPTIAPTTAATGATGSTGTTRPAKDADGFTIVRPTQLPKEAQQTLALVDKGGPFPYDRDGIEFQNREKILPKKPAGYYREYTVITPGSSDRGARRIIAGKDGERYYTADHYESFVRVLATS